MKKGFETSPGHSEHGLNGAHGTVTGEAKYSSGVQQVENAHSFDL